MRKNFLPLLLFATSALCAVSCASTGKTLSKEKGEVMQTSITKESQTLSMETLGNARELGGYRNLYGRKIKRGLLFRSAKPVSASENDLNRLKNEYQLTTIVDFRMSYEREAEPNPKIEGVNDFWCPIIDEDLISANVNMPLDSAKSMSTFDRLKIAIERGIITEKCMSASCRWNRAKKAIKSFSASSLPCRKENRFCSTVPREKTAQVLHLCSFSLPLMWTRKRLCRTTC